MSSITSLIFNCLYSAWKHGLLTKQCCDKRIIPGLEKQIRDLIPLISSCDFHANRSDPFRPLHFLLGVEFILHTSCPTTGGPKHHPGTLPLLSTLLFLALNLFLNQPAPVSPAMSSILKTPVQPMQSNSFLLSLPLKQEE